METGARGRTRRAILDAAVAVLSKEPGASLTDIANAAGVGRTTVHRYFPERSDLVTAIGAHALEQVAAASERARLDEGTASQALDRLCQEYFELGDILMLIYTEPQMMNSADWEQNTGCDLALLRVVERGHEEGTIDAAMPPVWVQALLWAMIYGAWEHSRTNCASKHEALALCLRSLRKALAA